MLFREHGQTHSTSRIALFRYLPRASFGCLFRQLLEGPKTKGFGRAGCHTCRFLSLGDQVHAQVALLHFSVGAKLGYTEGACHEDSMRCSFCSSS